MRSGEAAPDAALREKAMAKGRTPFAGLVVVIAAIAVPPILPAQPPTAHKAADSVVAVFERWADNYGAWLVQAFDSIPPTRYSYRPTPRQQSIGYIAQHLEDANYDLCERFAHLRYFPIG